MAQISGLLQEKTSLVDNDLMAIDDSQATNRSRKVKFSTIWNYIIGKLAATASEINAVCAGNTATASEISQICAGRVAGGANSADIVTCGDNQVLKDKDLLLPTINDYVAITANGSQINTLANTTGTGRVNEVQQGLAVGNPTITASGSYVYTGLVNVNFSSSGSFSFGPASSINKSAQVLVSNISSTTVATIAVQGSDKFILNGTTYTSIAIAAGGSLAMISAGDGIFLVQGYARCDLS